MNEDIGFELDSEVEPSFTLTCISTGGPATTVTWSTESGVELREQQTVLTDAATAEYTHMLNVTGRHGGNYTCTVSNSAPSEDTASIVVTGTYTQLTSFMLQISHLFTVASAPTDLKVVQEGLTSVRVSWTPPDPLGDTTGYRIYYTNGSGGAVGTEDVGDPRSTEFLVQGLVSGSSYSVSLQATSQHIPSELLSQSLQLVAGMM